MPTAAVHLALTESGNDVVEFRYWRDDPNRYTSRTLPLAQIHDLAKKSEADYYAIGTPDLVNVGRRLYRWLDGTDRWLARELEDLRGTEAVALMIEGRGRLAHLPWETLHDGTTFLVHGAAPPVLPVRWKRQGPRPEPPENRALSVLFMATSPQGVFPELNYEEEEGRILQATDRFRIALTVEETGNLKELAVLVAGYGEGHFDVLHLTGHADHRPEGPRFLTESESGSPEWVSAAEIAGAVPRRPLLTFLSGCRTGQSLQAGAVGSLAEQLLDQGFPAVLGWGRPVFDADAIVAAAALYESLAAEFGPVRAVLNAHAAMLKADAKHWHLLRLFAAGSVPPAPVTAPRTPGRKPPPQPTNQRRFLGRTLNVSGTVVDRKDFVGRRRPLQRFVRALRGNREPAGAVVFGMGGVGKSSLACRLCDRLEEFDPVVHFGVLDEPKLLRSLDQLSATAEERALLQASRDPLQHRLRAFLEARRDAGRKKLLLVLDDFEQNTPLDDQGKPLITPVAQTVLESLVWSVEATDAARCLITSRYKLTVSQAGLFYQGELGALRSTEMDKKRRSLGAYRSADESLRKQADRVSDGNPRLMERLDRVMVQPGLDHAEILRQLEATAADFREEVLARALLAGLTGPTRQILAGSLVYQLPVPFEAITALFPGRPADDVRTSLDAAVAPGLVEQEPEDGTLVFRVPRLLEPLLASDQPSDMHAMSVAAVEALYWLWWKSGTGIAEPQALELLRLACQAGRGEIAAPVADRVGRHWIDAHRYREAFALYEATIAAVGRDYRLLGGMGRVAQVFGDGDGAYRLLSECLKHCPFDDTDNQTFYQYQLAGLLVQRGELDEALRILREELLPVFERLGDARSRAVALGRVADVLQARGELDEALRIRREEQLPVYERLGDVQARAVTLSNIADMLVARGELDEALRIWRNDVLPSIRRVQDFPSLAALLVRLGFYSAKMGLVEEAGNYLREARELVIRLRDDDALQMIDQMLDALKG